MYNPGERRLLAKIGSPKLFLKKRKKERERKKKMNVLNQIKFLNIFKANDTINKKGQSRGKKQNAGDRKYKIFKELLQIYKKRQHNREKNGKRHN